MRTTQICSEAYSPGYNTQPFIPIHLHRRKHRLRTEDRRAAMLAVAVTTCPIPFRISPRWPPHGGTARTPCCVTTYSLVRRRHPRFFLTLDPSHVPPRSVIVVGIVIVPIEQYGDQIGRQIVPAIGGTGDIIEAWLGPMGFLEYYWYPGEEASL